jgi:HEAT repeat protein
MQQHVTIAPLRAGDAVVGVTVTIEDVTARRDRERELARRLAHPDEAERLRAVRELGASRGADDDPPAEPLAGALGDASWKVRRAAAESLARVRGVEAAALLLAAVRERHRDLAVLNAAISAIRETRYDVVPALVAMLDDADADVRTYVALALGLLEDRRAVAPLVRTLGDADANVRFHAVEALGRIGAREAAEPLAAVATAGDFATAFAALDALALVGEPAVAPRLVPLLDDPLLADEAAAHALGELGGEEAVAPLARLFAATDAAARTAGTVALARLADRLGTAVPDLARAALAGAGADAGLVARRLAAALPAAPRPGAGCSS